MLKARPTLRMGLTHAAALLIGWGSWTVLRSSHTTDGEPSSFPTKPQTRPTTPASAGELLATLAKPGTAPASSHTTRFPAGTEDPENPPDQKTWDRLTVRNLNDRLAGTGDLSYQFRTGNLDAAQVLAQLEQELPELAKKSPAAFRETIFKNLVEQNPHAAMPLLAGLSPGDRHETVLRAARIRFVRTDPAIFLAALREVPADDASLREGRLLAWTAHAKNNHKALDGEYVDWVRSLPEGVDREMALYSLSSAIADKHPELAATLRGELRDQDLKQRLAGEP